MTDTRILIIDGFQLPGLLTLNELPLEQDVIEVPENGFIRLIYSGIKKIPEIEIAVLVKRDSVTLRYVYDWEDQGGDAKDLIMISTDKSGKMENQYLRETYIDCELGTLVKPAFDQGAREKAMLTFKLAPYDYERRTIP